MEYYFPAIVTGIVALIGFLVQYHQFKKQIKETRKTNALSYLVESRGHWINTTRNYFSEYISSIIKLMDNERYYIIDCKQNISDDLQGAKILTELNSENIRCKTVLLTSFNVRDANGSDKDIIDAINEMGELLEEYYKSLKELSDSEINKNIELIDGKIKVLCNHVSEYFKTEWEKIKNELGV